MSYAPWLQYLASANKTSTLSGRSRKVFYEFPDGQRMAEEYSLDTGVLLRRAWRKSKTLMGEPDWEIELGETPKPLGGGDAGADLNGDKDFTLTESNTAPILSKRLTKKSIEWRVRNLPYSLDVYKVQADAAKKAIVISTTNKKYYKVLQVPELDRCGLVPSQANISFTHSFNTLIVTYKKPDLVLEMEAQVLLLLKDVETETEVDQLLQGLLKK